MYGTYKIRGMYSNIVLIIFFTCSPPYVCTAVSEQQKSSPVVNFTPVKTPGYKPRLRGQVDNVSGLSCQ